MISVSTLSKPSTLRGSAARASPRTSSSLKQGIRMMSFTRDAIVARPTAPGRRTGPRIGRVAAFAAGGVPAVEVAAAVGLDQAEELPIHVRLRAPERERALVDVPHEQALARQPAIGAHAGAVLEQVVLLGVRGRGRDLHHARLALDLGQRHAARRARDRLDLHPAEAELRPRAQMRRPLAAPEPGPLPHQAPDADALLRLPARGAQLRQAVER